jgi:DNA-binding transcriptional LysR family regulator
MRNLQLFVAAYEERSFTLAAVREGATQSGVSQHVRNLEERYGVQLFRREKGKVLPTPAADVFYSHCLQALRASDTAFQRLKQFSFGLAGETSIGLMPTLNAAALAPALMLFRERHPNAHVSVTESYSAALVERVIAGDLDLAVVPAMPEMLGVRIRNFCATPEVMVTRRDSAAPGPLRLAGLGPIKLVLPELANVRAQTVRALLAAQNVEIAETIEMNSMLATLDLISRSDWCAILPELLMATKTYGDAFDVRPLDPPIILQLVTVASAASSLSPIASAFCNVLRDSCEALLLERHPQG